MAGRLKSPAVGKLGITVKGFDIFNILVNYWQQQLKNPRQLAASLESLLPTKAEYARVKRLLSDHWQQKIRLSKLELAAYYFFNHNLSYGPGFLGWVSKAYLNQNRYQKMVQKVANFHSQALFVSCADFTTSIPQHSKDFLYCDPPYFLDGDSRVFKGIYPQRNFPIHHRHFDHQQLKNMLCEHQGGFILSYNDCGQIRKWYQDFKILPLSWQYTMGQGETRIGKHRQQRNSNHTKKSTEVLILGY